MKQSDYLRELEGLFELDPHTVTTDSVLQDLDGWGSLTFLGLLSMTDGELGITLSPQQVLKCATVGDLLKLLGSTIEAD